MLKAVLARIRQRVLVDSSIERQVSRFRLELAEKWSLRIQLMRGIVVDHAACLLFKYHQNNFAHRKAAARYVPTTLCHLTSSYPLMSSPRSTTAII